MLKLSSKQGMTEILTIQKWGHKRVVTEAPYLLSAKYEKKGIQPTICSK